MAYINKGKLEQFLSSQRVKILNINNLELIDDGHYRNLKYCSQIERNSTGNRGYHTEATTTNGYEEFVRMYLLTKLCNELGYKPNDIEIERKFSSGSRGSGDDYLDICVYDKNDKNNIFLFIELKSSEDYQREKENSIQNQLYKLAAMAKQESPSKTVKYLVYFTAFTDSRGRFQEKCEIIDFQSYPTYQDYKNIIIQGGRFDGSLPSNYGVIRKELYGNVLTKGNGLMPLEYVITTDVSNSLASNLHNLLWGGGSGTDNKIFGSLTKIILTKLYDEEITPSNSAYNFQIKTKRDTRRNVDIAETNDEVYERLDALYKRAAREKLFTDNPTNHIIDEGIKGKLKQTVILLQSYNFTKTRENGVDILGKFFETIVSREFKQSSGQFFTPYQIVRFMINGLKLDELIDNKFINHNTLPYVIDPSCGSGTFLIEYIKYVTQHLSETYLDSGMLLSRSQRDTLNQWIGQSGDMNYWAKTFIYGSEISPDLGAAIKVNMVMHGDGASNIFCGEEKGDGLIAFSNYVKPSGETSLLSNSAQSNSYGHEVNEKFDVIISNPPFSVLLQNSTIEHIKSNYDTIYKGGKTKNSECVFVERFYQLLKPKGRMAVILPESIFDGSDSLETRKFIFKYFDVKAIVSLPITAFQPYTSTKVSILFAQKKSANEVLRWNEQFNELKQHEDDEVKIYNQILDGMQHFTLMINVDDVGYRMTKTMSLPRPNELYSRNDSTNVIFRDMENDKYAIHDLRQLEWEE